MTTMLSDHFSLAELVASDTAVRLGIDNTPDYHALSNLHGLASGLELVREVLGAPVHVNSGFRCEELERVICRKSFVAWTAARMRATDEAAWGEYFSSKGHPKGYCADIIAPAFGSPRQIVKAIVAAGIKFDQCIEEGTWVHISFDPRMRGQVLTAKFVGGVATYSAGVS